MKPDDADITAEILNQSFFVQEQYNCVLIFVTQVLCQHYIPQGHIRKATAH